MAAKSAVKKLSKTSDLDAAVVMAAEIDSLSDLGKADFKQVIEAKSRDEIFDAFAAQQTRQALAAPGENDRPLTKMDLDNIPTGRPEPEKATVSNKQTQAQSGPPPGHPAAG